jgi:hypothetical protein
MYLYYPLELLAAFDLLSKVVYLSKLTSHKTACL